MSCSISANRHSAQRLRTFNTGLTVFSLATGGGSRGPREPRGVAMDGVARTVDACQRTGGRNSSMQRNTVPHSIFRILRSRIGIGTFKGWDTLWVTLAVRH